MGSMEIDKTGLDSRVFDAFAETSKKRYIYLSNLHSGVTRLSKRAVEYFGLPAEYMTGMGEVWLEMVHPDDREILKQDFDAILSGKKENHDMEYRIRNKENNYIICACRGVMLKGTDGEPDLLAGTIVNYGIVENIDSATGLYNIYEFMNAMRRVRRQKERGLVLKIGINQFHVINDVYGFAFGNEVLRTFAASLRNLAGSSGTAYRMDGAKFALYMRNAGAEQAEELYHQIQTTALEKIIVENTRIPLSISGGAMAVDRGSGEEYSIRASTAYALEQSKRRFHGELVLYSNELLADSRKKLELMNLIKQCAVDRFEGFYLCYQPIVAARSGEIVGMEALLRWHNDDYGEVPPADFIPWLENDPCFYELGNWILRQALTDAKPIVQDIPGFVINVNVSYTQLERSGFRDSVMDILHETGFPAKNLCIELTERCRMMDIGRLREELRFFRMAGISIALDDFGTGASSLNLLQEIPTDCLKIDRAFTSHLQKSQSCRIIVKAIIRCAKELGLQVCIEGVEDLSLSRYLITDFPADSHQGYLYSRPVPIDAFKRLLISGLQTGESGVDKISVQC